MAMGGAQQPRGADRHRDDGVHCEIYRHPRGTFEDFCFFSAGGAISFGVVKKIQKNVKSVLSDVQQFYWMNNLCSQSERSC